MNSRKRNYKPGSIRIIRMKRFSAAVVFIVLLMLSFHRPAMAENSYTSGEYQYCLLEDGTAEITYYWGDKSADIVIPTEVDGILVTSIGNGAFFQAFINSVEIPESIKKIGKMAFAYNNIPELEIPVGVEEIGPGAFSYSTNLISVDLPDSLQSLGEGVFAFCPNLAKIIISSEHPTLEIIEGGLFSRDAKCLICYPPASMCQAFSIPEGTERIGAYAFPTNQHLITLEIPASVTEIGELALPSGGSLESITVLPKNPVFESADGVLFNRQKKQLISYPCSRPGEKYTVPEGTVVIGIKAFSNGRNLREVSLPDSVTTIEDNAFYNCRNLISITVPDSVTSIGEDAFGSNVPLFDNPNMTVNVKEGSFTELYCQEHKLRCCNEKGDITNAESSYLQWLLTAIEDNLKDNKNSHENVDSHGEKLKTSGKYQYRMLENGTAEVVHYQYPVENDGIIYIPAYLDNIKITAIGMSTFAFSQVRDLVIPEGVETIGSFAFSGCEDLSKVSLPDGLKAIGMSAFENCSKLKRITIPESVTSIGNNAFGGSSSQKTLIAEKGSYAEKYCKENNIRCITPERDKLRDKAFLIGALIILADCLTMLIILGVKNSGQAWAAKSFIDRFGNDEVKARYDSIHGKAGKNSQPEASMQMLVRNILFYVPSLCRNEDFADFADAYEKTLFDMECTEKTKTCAGGISAFIFAGFFLFALIASANEDDWGTVILVLLLVGAFTAGGVLCIKDVIEKKNRKTDYRKYAEQWWKSIEKGLLAIKTKLPVIDVDWTRHIEEGPFLAVYDNLGNNQLGGMCGREKIPEWVIKSGKPLLWANYVFNQFRLCLNDPVKIQELAKYFPEKNGETTDPEKDTGLFETLREHAFYFVESIAQASSQYEHVMGAVLDLAVDNSYISLLCVRGDDELKASLYGKEFATVLDIHKVSSEIEELILQILDEAEQAQTGMKRVYDADFCEDGQSVAYVICRNGIFKQTLFASQQEEPSGLESAVGRLLENSRIHKIMKKRSEVYIGGIPENYRSEDLIMEEGVNGKIRFTKVTPRSKREETGRKNSI